MKHNSNSYGFLKSISASVLICMQMPKIKEYTSKAGCCFGACCSWGSVKSTLQLQRGAFIPGEAIHFIADIANRSSKMCSVEVSLVEV